MSTILQKATIKLTATQLLSLGSSPSNTVAFLSAPGSKLAIMPLWVSAEYDPSDTPFTVGATGNLQVCWNNGGTLVSWAKLALHAFMSGAAANSKIVQWLPNIPAYFPITNLLTAMSNMPVVINSTATMTGGDGSITTNMWYVVVPLNA